MAILGRPIRSGSEQREQWRRGIAQVDFDPAAEYVAPDEARRAPRLALQLRLNILLRTYQHDYHTDALDPDGAVASVRSGGERIAFWGDAASVGAVRAWIGRDAQPGQRDFDALDLGTATVRDAADEFGPGYAEMCRTGSTSKSVTALGPILHELAHLCRAAEPNGRARYHTFASVPRNRPSQANLRGGAAIHRLHVRDVGSSFWGVAPWYVMQGGALEMLDYREVYAAPTGVLDAIATIEELYCSSRDEAEYVAALLELNVPAGRALPRVQVGHQNAAASRVAGWSVHRGSSAALAPYNPALIRPDPAGPCASLAEAIALDDVCAHACASVYVPLESSGGVGLQHFLNKHGFSLAMVVPPKDARPRGTAGDRASRASCFGVWSRPRPGPPVAAPYYLGHAGHSAVEQRILAYLAGLHERWSLGGGGGT